MNDAALDQFLAHCSQQLEEQQSKMVREFQFDRCDRFAVDLERGQLVAECRGEAIAITQVIPIAILGVQSSRVVLGMEPQSSLPELLRRQQAIVLPVQASY